MFKKLKKKFILLATVSTVAFMILLVGIMNVVNYTSVVAEADEILEVLSAPNTPFEQEKRDKPQRNINDFIPRGMSPEVPYESRYFRASVTEDGEVKDVDVSRIVSVDWESAETYAHKAVAEKKNRGFIGQFRYLRQTDDRMTRIMFLDCGRRLDSFSTFMWTCIAVGLAGCIILFVVFLFAAGRIVRPIAESYEKQKRFITDAGHEIKTPLTIIGANLDLLETDCGENESIAEIRTQTNNLASLTGKLVYLSKMEENENNLVKIDFPVSDCIAETARQFAAIAQSKKLAYRVNIIPNLTMHGAPEAVFRLFSILLDNAMKYSPSGGIVTLDMSVQKKALHVSVFNTTATPVNEENITRLFDRFYRADASRNSENGGHGIGLSLAQAITAAHNGKITAETQSGMDFRITVILPMQP